MPRRPTLCHVSWNCTSAAGKKQTRCVPSSHIAPPTIQEQCCVPLPHCQRPVTLNPSSTRTPRPFGANTPPVAVAGLGYTVAAASGGRNAAIDDVVDAIAAHHPAAPSPRATSATASINSTGETPGPPYARGRHSVSSPGVGERGDGARREPSHPLRLVGGLRGRDRDLTGTLDDVHGGRS